MIGFAIGQIHSFNSIFHWFSGSPGHCLNTGQHCWRIDGGRDVMSSSGREMVTVKAERGLCGGDTVSFLPVA